METTRYAWLLAGLLALSGAALAQPTPLGAGSPPPASATPPLAAPADERPVLGGPPQFSATEPDELALLPPPPVAQPPRPAELAQLFPQCVHPRVGFQPDIAALAKATALAGSRGLVALALPLGAASVPAGGAAPGQRLRLLTAAGEQLVAVARPAATGSHLLVVSAAPGLAGQLVFVAGLEHPAEPALDYEALALLQLSTARQLAQQVAAMQQQLASLRSQLATARQINGALLLEQAKQADLREQLNLLQSQRAAVFSEAHSRPRRSWLTD